MKSLIRLNSFAKETNFGFVFAIIFAIKLQWESNKATNKSGISIRLILATSIILSPNTICVNY